MSIALLTECLDTALCSGIELEEPVGEEIPPVAAFVPTPGYSDSNNSQGVSAQLPDLETTNTGTTNLPSSSESSAVRKRARPKYLNSKERNAVARLLCDMERQSAVNAVITEAKEELHMSEYPARKLSLDANKSVWIGVIGILFDLYRKLYTECSSTCAADRYAAFQIHWVISVSGLVSCPTLAALPLEIQDTSSVLHSLAAAAWKHCCNVIRSYLKERASVAAANVVPVQLEEKHYWRFFGWAVCSSVDILNRKRARQNGKLSTTDSKELKLLHTLRLQSKEEKCAVDTIPLSLQLLDEGWLSYLRSDHLPFARNALAKIYAVANHDGFNTYGENFIHVVSQCVKLDKTLHLPLIESVAAAHPDQFDNVTIEKVSRGLVLKVLNAVLGEVVETAEQIMLLDSGSTTTSGLNLRDKLHPANA